MPVELHADAFISALGGCGIAVAIAKYTIGKALRDLDKLSEKVNKIDKELSNVLVRLEKLTEHDTTLKDHTKKLSYLEALDDARAQRSLQ